MIAGVPDTFVTGQGVEAPIEFINAATQQSRFDVFFVNISLQYGYR
jgi:hypothetical protein